MASKGSGQKGGNGNGMTLPGTPASISLLSERSRLDFRSGAIDRPPKSGVDEL